MAQSGTTEAADKHPVLEIIRDRISSGSKPGLRSDPHSLAVVIEGGGMRGVVASAMLAALEQLGLRDAFDAVYGSSAGSMGGAYFITGQSTFGTTVYYDELLTREFFAFRRALGRASMMSVDHLVDVIIERLKPLKWDRLFSSSIPLSVVATAVRTLEPVMFRIKNSDISNSKEALREVFRASATIPLWAGGPVRIDDELFWDSSLSVSIPFQAALDDGHTHIAVAKTRPRGVLRSPPHFIEEVFVIRRLASYNPDLPARFRDRPRMYAEEVEKLQRLVEAGTAFVFEPSEGAIVPSQFERSRARLVEGARIGMQAVYKSYCGCDPMLVEVLGAYT